MTPILSWLSLRTLVRSFRFWAVAFVILGIVARLVRYGVVFPFWGDEAFVALNVIDRDFFSLTRQLDQLQVAPIPFLWAERAIGVSFGYGEWALCLPPLFAGIVALVLFWRLARIAVPVAPAAVAIGLLAVSRFPVTLCAQVKPYSFDLLAAVALLLPAVFWLRRPERLAGLWAVCVVVPCSVASSFPAVFVAGGVSLALLPTAWRHPQAAARLGYVTFNLFMVTSFLIFDLWLARSQLGPAGTTLHDYMTDYWKHGFPPSDISALPGWLAKVHTGLLFAYPLGNANGAGALAFPLAAVGAWRIARSGRSSLLVLLLAPFALNLVAAAMHCYPYGGCCRLSQHLAPAVCLLVGVGVDTVARWWSRGTIVRAWCVGLMALGVVGMALAIACPYREVEDRDARQAVDQLSRLIVPDDQVVVLTTKEQIEPVLRWYLRAADWDRVEWEGNPDWDRVRAGGRVWCLTQRAGAPVFPSPVDIFVARSPFRMVRLANGPSPFPLNREYGIELEAICFVRE